MDGPRRRWAWARSSIVTVVNAPLLIDGHLPTSALFPHLMPAHAATGRRRRCRRQWLLLGGWVQHRWLKRRYPRRVDGQQPAPRPLQLKGFVPQPGGDSAVPPSSMQAHASAELRFLREEPLAASEIVPAAPLGERPLEQTICRRRRGVQEKNTTGTAIGRWSRFPRERGHQGRRFARM